VLNLTHFTKPNDTKCVYQSVYQVYQMIYPNFYVNLTQDEYVRKKHKHHVKINSKNVTL